MNNKLDFNQLQSEMIADIENSVEQPAKGRYEGILRVRKQKPSTTSRENDQKLKIVQRKRKNSFHVWLQLQMPLSQRHVYNYCNFVAINQRSIIDPEFQESFISSKFYNKIVKKVVQFKETVILHLQNSAELPTPTSYICERLRSLGCREGFQIACQLQEGQKALQAVKKQIQLQKTSETSEEIENNAQNSTQNQTNFADNDSYRFTEFIKQMQGKMYFSQLSSKCLVISYDLLKFCGYDIDSFCIECIKYKSILEELFSAYNYIPILQKHLENLSLLYKHLTEGLPLQTFIAECRIHSTDYINTHNDRRIRCQVIGGSSKQYVSYIEVKKIGNQEQNRNKGQFKEKKERFCEKYRQNEIKTLRRITELPISILPENKSKICHFKYIEQSKMI